MSSKAPPTSSIRSPRCEIAGARRAAPRLTANQNVAEGGPGPLSRRGPSGMLEVRSLCKYFGGIRAVDACSFTVARGSITALIGPNGAGKTTAFNCICK
ncbi:MAG TPA: ATP-binding cassette domain-containing protein, partial [Geminicoccaceae bacterium]|nr:ATP-binding cassette domain-containing protein [Geminicoccaceae bacterium]